MRKGLIGKLIVYALLLAGSVLFLVPLLWMISTALKPIDQTMNMPPQWLPYEQTIVRDGTPVAVLHAERIEQASTVVEFEDGTRAIVPPTAIEPGDTMYLRRSDADGKSTDVPVTVIHEVPAAVANPWYRVDLAGSEWIVVPASDLTQHVRLRWGNFSEAIKAMGEFPRYLLNTLFLCVLTVLGSVLSSSLAAYGFSRIEWRGRDKVFLIVLATMMVPFPVLMVPLYSIFKWLGWIGTLKPLWVGSFFAAGFNVFLLRQFFLTIPKELSEASRIDGCSEWRIYWQIILPLSKPALMVVGLFQFMYTWNDFLGPLIFLTDQRDFTLALGLQFFQSQHGGTEWHYLMAASALICLPIVVLFFFAQRTFIEGISMTGLKG